MDLHQHISKWQNRLNKGYYADFNDAFKKLIYSLWLSEELKSFMTLALSEAVLDELLAKESIAGSLYYDYNPYELNAWCAKKFRPWHYW